MANNATNTNNNATSKKAYKFISTNKYLTVATLGVQFMDGKATVTDVEVAKALATLDGVTVVEE